MQWLVIIKVLLLKCEVCNIFISLNCWCEMNGAMKGVAVATTNVEVPNAEIPRIVVVLMVSGHLTNMAL